LKDHLTIEEADRKETSFGSEEKKEQSFEIQRKTSKDKIDTISENAS